MSLVWHSHFNKAKGGSCNHCLAFSGTRVRVFASQADFEQSDFYAGGDELKDEPGGALTAVWPGKHNVGRKAEDFWLCIPVHPNCGCGWREIGASDEGADWFADISSKEIEQYTSRR